jgi:hypothetical protein
MDRRVDQDQLWIVALRALRCPETAVNRAVVDDPEDAASIVVRRSRHDLLHETVKGVDAVLGFAAAKDPGMVNIQTRDVGPGPAPKVLMLYLHRAPWAAGTGGVFAPPHLNAGFLVGRDHELFSRQDLNELLAKLNIPSAKVEAAKNTSAYF